MTRPGRLSLIDFVLGLVLLSLPSSLVMPEADLLSESPQACSETMAMVASVTLMGVGMLLVLRSIVRTRLCKRQTFGPSLERRLQGQMTACLLVLTILPLIPSLACVGQVILSERGVVPLADKVFVVTAFLLLLLFVFVFILRLLGMRSRGIPNGEGADE